MMPPDPYADFDHLYRGMRLDLDRFVHSATAAGQMDANERAWFNYLSDNFEYEFDKWGQYGPGPIRDYLDSFTAAPKPLRLAAHVFLHIAFDLPRVIAPTLHGLPAQERARRRTLFLLPSAVFRQRFRERLKAGDGGLLARPLGYLKHSELLSYWLLCLRSVAWIHAEILADAPHHAALVGALARAMRAAAVSSKREVWELDNALLFRALPVLLTPENLLAGLAVAAAGSAFVWGAGVRQRNHKIGQQIELLGACVQIETARAMGLRLADEGRLAPGD